MAEQKKSVIHQAAFLMAATMICRVIGLLYRSPLHGIMGDVGDGYYTYAYEWYNIILLISSYSIPMAVSKVMAERIATGRHKDASKIFRASLIYVVIAGTIGALCAFLLAPVMLKGQEGAIPALRVLAPTIFLSGVLGVLRGYFQAQNSMKQTAVSQVFEQIVNAVVSVLAAYILTRPFAGNEAKVSEYGAAGGTIGTGAGVITALIIVFILFMRQSPARQRSIANDDVSENETYGMVFRTIFLMVTPVILATCVYNISSVVDQRIYASLSLRNGLDKEAVSAAYGLFGYQFKPIINIPIALASATSTALIPQVASGMALKDKKGVIGKIDEAYGFTTFIAIPAAVGLCILSYPVIRILYPGSGASKAAVLLSVGAVSVIFYCLSTVTNGVLQGMGKPSIPVKNAALSLVINVISLVIMMGVFKMQVMAVLFSTIIYALSVFVLNSAAIRKRIKYRAEIKNSYIIPAAASAIMGAAVAAIYWIPAKLAGDVFSHYIPNLLLAMISVLAGILIYVISYAVISGKDESEMRKLPMGRLLVKMLGILHIRLKK